MKSVVVLVLVLLSACGAGSSRRTADDATNDPTREACAAANLFDIGARAGNVDGSFLAKMSAGIIRNGNLSQDETIRNLAGEVEKSVEARTSRVAALAIMAIVRRCQVIGYTVSSP